MPSYKRIVLAERPTGDIVDSTFRTETATVPDKSSLKADHVLIKVEHLSLDPGTSSLQVSDILDCCYSLLLHNLVAMRGWLRDTRSYLPPVQIGEVMRAIGVGSIVAAGSAVKNLQVGDKVEGVVGECRLDLEPKIRLSRRLVSPTDKFCH